MLLPLTMKAQYREDRYGIKPWFEGESLLGKEGTGGTREQNSSLTGSLGGAQQEDPTSAPLGSGIVVLLTAGAGYALLKRKEETK